MFMAIEKKSFRVYLNGDRLARWDSFLESKVIDQQRAIEQLIDFITRLPDVAQSVVLGQLKPTPDNLRCVFGVNLPARPTPGSDVPGEPGAVKPIPQAAPRPATGRKG